jgi:hypothetical protein
LHNRHGAILLCQGLLDPCKPKGSAAPQQFHQPCDAAAPSRIPLRLGKFRLPNARVAEAGQLHYWEQKQLTTG